MEQDNLKIAIYTRGDFPYGGASENFVRQLALGLHENHCQVEVIRWKGMKYETGNDVPVTLTDYLFKKPAKTDFFKLVELICQVIFIPFSLGWRRFVKKEKIVFLYGLEYMYIVFHFMIWTRFFGIKCYRILTDCYRTESIAPVWWKKPKILFYNLQRKYIDRYLHGIIVLSRYLYIQCLENHVKEDRLLLIPHFIDLNTSKVAYSEANSRVTIGYCGYVSASNGVLDLVKAFFLVSTLYDKAELIIIGAISNEMEQELSRLHYENYNIRLAGFLDKSDVERELSQCTILVNPRQTGEWSEAGFPTKLGEYFATGRPVVSTGVGDLLYYFTDKVELVFAKPENTNSMAEAMVYLISNPASAQKIGLNGYAWAEENLHYITNSKKLINFILEAT
jgi:glycosyltransferase involved in cell wall biosynthesis